MSQLTLSLFDTTALGGLTLGASSAPRLHEHPVQDDGKDSVHAFTQAWP